MTVTNDALLQRQARQRFRLESFALFKSNIARWIVIAFCFCSDAFTVFTLFDVMYRQDPLLSAFNTAAVAVTLNLIPMLIAATLQNKYFKKHVKILFFLILLAVFLAAFTFTCFLRWETIDLLISADSASASMSTTFGSLNDAVEQPVTETVRTVTVAERWLSVIMAALPFLTSLICFWLTWEQIANQKQAKRALLEKQAIQLQKELDQTESAIAELHDELRFDLEGFDAEQYRNACAEVDTLADNALVLSRMYLAEKLRTPGAITYAVENTDENKIIIA